MAQGTKDIGSRHMLGRLMVVVSTPAGMQSRGVGCLAVERRDHGPVVRDRHIGPPESLLLLQPNTDGTHLWRAVPQKCEHCAPQTDRDLVMEAPSKVVDFSFEAMYQKVLYARLEEARTPSLISACFCGDPRAPNWKSISALM